MKSFYDLLIAGSSFNVPTAIDSINARRDVTETVNNLLLFIQIFSLLGGIILIIMAIRKFISCSKIDKEIKKKQLENLATPAEIEEEKLRNDDQKGKGILWIVPGIAMLAGTFIIELLKVDKVP